MPIMNITKLKDMTPKRKTVVNDDNGQIPYESVNIKHISDTKNNNLQTSANNFKKENFSNSTTILTKNNNEKENFNKDSHNTYSLNWKFWTWMDEDIIQKDNEIEAVNLSVDNKKTTVLGPRDKIISESIENKFKSPDYDMRGRYNLVNIHKGDDRVDTPSMSKSTRRSLLTEERNSIIKNLEKDKKKSHHKKNLQNKKKHKNNLNSEEKADKKIMKVKTVMAMKKADLYGRIIKEQYKSSKKHARKNSEQFKYDFSEQNDRKVKFEKSKEEVIDTAVTFFK